MWKWNKDCEIRPLQCHYRTNHRTPEKVQYSIATPNFLHHMLGIHFEGEYKRLMSCLDDVERGVADRTTLSIDLSYNEAVAE